MFGALNEAAAWTQARAGVEKKNTPPRAIERGGVGNGGGGPLVSGPRRPGNDHQLSGSLLCESMVASQRVARGYGAVPTFVRFHHFSQRSILFCLPPGIS